MRTAILIRNRPRGQGGAKVGDDELIAMADMYASSCTRQQEKYESFQRRGYTWRWEDCEAAYDLICALPNYWELVEAWRKEHKCRSCGFPKDAHAVRCTADN